MDSDKPPQMLSIKAFAKLCDVSEWLIEQACKSNELPHARIGRRILIPEDALLRQIEGRGWKRVT